MEFWLQILTGLVVVGIGLWLARSLRISRLDRDLSRPRVPRRLRPAGTAALTGAESVGWSIIGEVRDMARLDPNVMAALERTGRDGLDTVADVDNYLSRIVAPDGSLASGILANNLKGFVGEEVARDVWEEQGKGWILHEQPNVPGTDGAFEDGSGFNVKTTRNPETVADHFSDYPEVPVVLPEDAAPFVGLHPQIHYLSGFREADAVAAIEATAAAAESGSSLLDAAVDSIPIITIGLSTVRVLQAYRPEAGALRKLGTIATQATAVTAGASVGAVAGGLIGSVGTASGAIGAETIGSIAGAGIGAAVGKAKAGRWKNPHYLLAKRSMKKTGTALGIDVYPQWEAFRTSDPLPFARQREITDRAVTTWRTRDRRFVRWFWPNFGDRLARQMAVAEEHALGQMQGATDRAIWNAHRLLASRNFTDAGLFLAQNPWILGPLPAASQKILGEALKARDRVARELWLTTKA